MVKIAVHLSWTVNKSNADACAKKHGGGDWGTKGKKGMSEIVATYVIATWPPNCQPIRTPTDCAKITCCVRHEKE